MSPIVHAELAWLCAQKLPTRRERILVTLAGVAPDLDGIGLVLYPWDGGVAYGNWHHLVFHNLFAAVIVAALCSFAGWRCGLLAFAVFHLHLGCDLLGSGAGWPIAYLWPLTDRWTNPPSWAWELSSWQNGVIGVAATLACMATALPLRRTVLEVLSRRLDEAAVGMVRRLFGSAAG